VDPRTVEAQLLAWQDAGWLEYRGIGRDLLVALPPAPGDSHRRVDAMLADYTAGQAGRIAEMMAYATTNACRHAHISSYFGDQPMERCSACDNCTGQARRSRSPAPAAAITARPAAAGESEKTILLGVTQLPFALGVTGLARAFKGAPTSAVQADRFPLFGTLSELTRKRIGEMIAQLAERGLLSYFEKGGYRLLRVTEEGRRWLAAQEKAPRNDIPPGTKPFSPRTRPVDEEPTDCDKALFEALRVWRLEQARQMAKPPFVVFPDSVLRRIAAHPPRTLGELSQIKGIGPHKLEAYGQAVLTLISGRSPSPTRREKE
jgi:ATP-dependent DNA helicase RecQ